MVNHIQRNRDTVRLSIKGIELVKDKMAQLKDEDGKIISQTRFANDVGISDRTLRTVLRGSNVDRKTVLAIAQPLNLNINDIMEYGDDDSISNPFLPLSGMITNHHLFFNRQREIKSIFELLNSGSSVSLVGESAIGKSSLLQEIYRQVSQKLKPLRKTMYINLQLISNEEDFYGHLCDEIGIDNCHGNELTKKIRNQKILLLLDEIEKMTWDGFTRNLRAYIRGLAETNILKLVVASRTTLDVLFPDNIGETSPFEGICITQNLGVWSEEIIREFIKSRLQGREIQFTDDDIQEVINMSKGHPKILMKLCFDKYNDYVEGI